MRQKKNQNETKQQKKNQNKNWTELGMKLKSKHELLHLHTDFCTGTQTHAHKKGLYNARRDPTPGVTETVQDLGNKSDFKNENKSPAEVLGEQLPAQLWAEIGTDWIFPCAAVASSPCHIPSLQGRKIQGGKRNEWSEIQEISFFLFFFLIVSLPPTPIWRNSTLEQKTKMG